MIREQLQQWWGQICTAIFMWSGERVFPIRVVWRETPEKEFSVCHFAWSQRDLNCAVRSYVEELDQPNTNETI